MMILTYYFSLFFQYLIPNFVYISLALGIFVLFDQIFKKKDDLYKIFLILLPSLSPLTLNDQMINNIIIFFNISIDLVLVAGFFYFIRNCIFIKLNKVNYILLLYLILLVYALINLFYIYFDNQQHNQGLTYAFRAILYICPLFIKYNNHYSEFKKQIFKIVKISLFLFIIRILIVDFESIKLTGHLVFLAASFPALIVSYKTNLTNSSFYLLSLFLVLSQSFTVLSVFFISSLIIFFRKLSIVSNRFNYFLLINFQIIVIFLALLFYQNLFEIFNLDNFFSRKLLLDRFPLLISSIQNIDIFAFQLNSILIELDNNITTADTLWESGSHNYFLTITTKLGLLPALIMLFVINYIIINLYKKIRYRLYLNDKIFFLLFISLVSSYSVFSATGNAYAEITGFIFFLLLGSLNSIVNSNLNK